MTGVFYQWNLPASVMFGRAVSSQLPERLRSMGIRKPILITDPGVAASGNLEKITRILTADGIAFDCFTDVVPEPPVDCLAAARARAAENCDGVIGLGGGSALDVAKVLALLLRHGGEIQDYAGVGAVRERGLPTLLLPTTAGTGSEVTPVAILTDTRAQLKIGIVSPLILPTLAIVDPELTDSMPPYVTAATGMDALTHAIESMISRKASPFSQALSLEAARLIGRSLRAAYRDGANRLARDEMALASTLAGLAFANASCCAVHALAYPLGGRHHVPHGQANAMLLAATMRFNAPACIEPFARLAGAMGLHPATPEALLAELESLRKDLEIPASLAALGVTEDELPAMARDAAAIERLIAPNPRPVTPADAEAIYRSIL